MWPLECGSSLLAEIPMPSWSLFAGIMTLGVTLLSIAMLVLTRSRWGQVKPVTKCIALSVFAHLLLVIYAYDTALLVVPQTPQEMTLPLGLIAAEELDEDATSQSDKRDQPTIEDQSHENPLAVKPHKPARKESDDRVFPADSPPETLSQTETKSPEESPTHAPNLAESQARAPVAPPALLMNSLPEADNPTAAVASASENDTQGADPAQAEKEPVIAEPANVVDNAQLRSAHEDRPGGIEDGDRVRQKRKLGSPFEPVTATPPAAVTFPASPSPRRKQGNSDESAAVDVYQNRQSTTRLQIALQYGGTQQTEAAVNRALAWLAAVQSPDGRWDADLYDAGKEKKILGHDRQGAGGKADTGISALALLAFLASGETHQSGHFRSTVQQGLEFLIDSQAPDGNFSGDAEHVARMYCHGMSLLALSEAYAMTGDERLLAAVQHGVDYSVAVQHFPSGGWRYSPREPGDMSQFGWQVMALKSAQIGGIRVPSRTWTGMRSFLSQVSSGPSGGLASYKPGERPSSTMTAEALTCRIFLGEYNSSNTLQEATNFILQELPNPQRANFYNWYYGTLALFQSQDPRWERWNNLLQNALLSTQRNDGRFSGSWDPDPVWGDYGGRIYSTALGALCLEVYYRYLPLTRESEGVHSARVRGNLGRSNTK